MKQEALSISSLVIFIFGLVYILIPLNQAGAESLSGAQIMQKVFDRDIGLDFSARYLMRLVDKKGRERDRIFELYWKKSGPENELMHQMTRFLSPPDIENTTFLTRENFVGDSTQYIYLPALKGVRRVGVKDKATRYVNTNFTYEDMERRVVSASKHRLLGRDTLKVTGWGSVNCFQVESIPLPEPPSQYQKTISWVHPNDYMVLRIDFYVKNKFVKKYTVHSIQDIDGVITEILVSMEDLLRNTSTFIVLARDTAKRNEGLKDSWFKKETIVNFETRMAELR